MIIELAQHRIYSGIIAGKNWKDESKRHDTANHLVQYDCKGLIDVNLDCINGVEVKN